MGERSGLAEIVVQFAGAGCASTAPGERGWSPVRSTTKAPGGGARSSPCKQVGAELSHGPAADGVDQVVGARQRVLSLSDIVVGGHRWRSVAGIDRAPHDRNSRRTRARRPPSEYVYEFGRCQLRRRAGARAHARVQS